MRAATVMPALLCLMAALLTMTIWAARRTHTAADFVLASRRLGPWLVGLGYAANAASAWMLMLVSAAAFTWGLSAVWLAAAILLGCIINLWIIAPRLRATTIGQGHVTLIQLLSADAGDRLQPVVARSAVCIALVTLLLQITAALWLASGLLGESFGFGLTAVILLSLALLTASVFAGGLRVVSAADTLQTILVLGVALFLLLPALLATGGWQELEAAFAVLGAPATEWLAGKSGVVALAFAAGTLSVAPLMWGQPQAVNRFMAAKDEAALRVARWIAPAWLAIQLAAVLLCGWCAQVLYAGLAHPEQALVALANRLLPPWLSAIIVLALAAAVFASIASPLLAIAISLAADMKRAAVPLSLPWLRVALLGTAVLAACVASYASTGLLEHAVFALTALGAAFGPLLLVRLSGKRIRPGSTLGAMWTGFVLSLLFHLLPDSPGDFLERVLPFIASLGIALTGGERRRNPDRADRSQETVHDRVPI